MMVVCPARSEPRMVLHTDTFAQAVNALGTVSFGTACFRVFEQCFDVDHWALFRYGSKPYVKCIATASRAHETEARRNVDFFLTRCHRVDPSLIAFREQRTQRSCLVKMAISDIDDRQYRHCFEVTNVHERMSFFAVDGGDLLQLCLYRAAADRTFSAVEMNLFSTLARLIVSTGVKHEAVWDGAASAHAQLDLVAIERRLSELGAGLSKRELEVCARAVAASTIDDTAAALRIKKTSVITYRQRAYQKLGISRQSDLVALVCNLKSTSDHVGDAGAFALRPLRVQ